MRLVFISDTHTQHARLAVPDGDVLIHCGDFTYRGLEKEVRDFARWFRRQKHVLKLYIAGNHDLVFEQDLRKALLWMHGQQDHLNHSMVYLQDEAYTWNCRGDDVTFWGSPWQPAFCNWAFNVKTEADLSMIWGSMAGTRVRPQLDVIITHGPCRGILDVCPNERGLPHSVGSSSLRDRIVALQPTVFACGHVHEGYGTAMVGSTLHVNASTCDGRYRPVNKPIVVDMKRVGAAWEAEVVL